ncbi:MAG: ChaN family lipoprotein [bacterium]
MVLGMVAQVAWALEKALKSIRNLVMAGLLFFGFLGGLVSEALADWPARPLIERLKDGSRMGLTRLTSELRGSPFVLVGELHDEPDHHRAQLMLIKALWEAKVPLAIGMEMFRTDAQQVLDSWVRGEISEEQMERVFAENWAETSWILYRDILLFAKEHSIAVLGLNIPREITQGVASKGYESLPQEMRTQWGEITCDVQEPHRSFLRWAFESHEGYKEEQWENFCQAQILWDTAMALRLLAFREANPDTTVVVLTGVGHAWMHGIPKRIALRSYLLCRVILPDLQGRLKEGRLSTEDADYLWLRY